MDADGERLLEGLVAHGHILPSDVPGVFGRGAVFEDVLERFNALVTASAAPDAPELTCFPPVIDRKLLERVDYLGSFPNLCGCVHSFFGDERKARLLSDRVKAGEPYEDLLGPAAVVLNPSACYPVYPTLRGTLPAGGRLITATNWVYRHEPSREPTRMQSYRVREFVRAGTPAEVIAWRDAWLERGLALLRGLGLPVREDVASDPFFGRAGKFLAASQQEQKLKYELLVPVISSETPTAVGSFNVHHDKFGAMFGIRSADGEVAHTACIGYGLERVVMALFRTHGLDPAGWPAEVRARLWP
ncbi:MAG: amino acid--[acyl-carrier-protein] ligase [Burkholderiales bacterium]|jgi:seryl-tRNA synthetase